MTSTVLLSACMAVASQQAVNEPRTLIEVRSNAPSQPEKTVLPASVSSEQLLSRVIGSMFRGAGVAWRITPDGAVTGNPTGDSWSLNGGAAEDAKAIAAPSGEKAVGGAKTSRVSVLDVNAWRDALADRFNTPACDRIVDALHIPNARTLGLQWDITAAADGPSLASAKLWCAARSDPPGQTRSIELTSTWSGSVEKRAFEGAAWITSLRADEFGLARLGTNDDPITGWASIVRKGASVIGGVLHAGDNAEDWKKWEASYDAWAIVSREPLRDLVSNIEQRMLVGGFTNGDGSTSIVAVLPAKTGRTKPGIVAALNRVKELCGLQYKDGVWSFPTTWAGGDHLVPMVQWTTQEKGKQVWIVFSIEPNGELATLTRVKLALVK